MLFADQQSKLKGWAEIVLQRSLQQAAPPDQSKAPGFVAKQASMAKKRAELKSVLKNMSL